MAHRDRIRVLKFSHSQWLLPAAAYCLSCGLSIAAFAAVPEQSSSQEVTREQALTAIHKAVNFFRQHCGYQGAYPYRTSNDLSKREGEYRMTATQGWMESPGTPAVGLGYLQAYEACGDPLLLEAARETGSALIRTQYVSGGWDHRMELDPEQRRGFAYRVDSPDPGKRRNHSTLDDDKSQSGLRFLMALDHVLDFSDPQVHEAAQYGLNAFLGAQFPNGAWAHGFDRPVNRSLPPDLQATIPETFVPLDKSDRHFDRFYTLNDNGMKTMIDTMLMAYDVYGEQRFLDSALRGGDFLLAAQLPAPQPAWAQQYDFSMQPVWARKFEPPAVSAGESQGVMMTLIELGKRTGDERYLNAVDPAIAYLRTSLLPDGRLARFYELKTNRPLYFTKTYQLTYDNNDLPTHYAFLIGSRLDSIETDLKQAREELAQHGHATRQPVQLLPEREGRNRSRSRHNTPAEIISALDERGAWVEPGQMKDFGPDDDTRRTMESRTFVRNLIALARHAGRTSGSGP